MNMEIKTLDDFYREAEIFTGRKIETLIPPGINKDIGHFNIFDIAASISKFKGKHSMPYNRRAYYKISLIRGRNRAEYADRIIEIETNALLFATPQVPYYWYPLDEHQAGNFCIFSNEFLSAKSGRSLEDFPIFRPGAYPVFEINTSLADEIQLIFDKMSREINSDYEYKYDLIRSYVFELIHYGQKLQPAAHSAVASNASARILSLFIELLERQFPVESQGQKLALRTASDYAERLSIHVNHLNKVLKEATGRTTTDIIHSRILQEAKILLRQTEWNIAEIAYNLGFEEAAHFSNFFKKQTNDSPHHYRSRS